MPGQLGVDLGRRLLGETGRELTNRRAQRSQQRVGRGRHRRVVPGQHHLATERLFELSLGSCNVHEVLDAVNAQYPGFDMLVYDRFDPATPDNILKFMGINVVSRGGRDAHDYAWAEAFRESASAAE